MTKRQGCVTGWRVPHCVLVVATFAAGLPMPIGADEPPAPVRDERHITQQHVKTWLERRRENIVMQSKDFSCGAAALATLLQHFWGDAIGEERLLRELDAMLTPTEIADRITNGLTLTDLRRVAVRLKYQATIGKLEFAKLAESRVPVVVGVTVRDYKHFVVYRGTDREYVYLADPARGNLRTPIGDFLEQWQDKAVLVVAKPDVNVPTSSVLAVREAEREFGWLNRQLLRRSFLSPTVAYPPTIRP